MSTLEVRDLAVEAGGKTVVEGLSFSLRAGDKVGVVGRNGAGKTSTLKVLAGEAPPLARHDRTPRRRARATSGRTLASIARTMRAPGSSTSCRRATWSRWRGASRRRASPSRSRTPIGTSSGSHAPRSATGTRAATRPSPRRARSRPGSGSPQDRLSLPVGALSGGERRRLELARILFGGSDLLLLDEPTNHLDADAKLWLMKFLATYKGGLMVVSHDLALLDASITRILHLDRDGVVEYRGTYSQYRESRHRDEVRLTALAQRQEQEIKRLKTLADSMRGQTAKRARKAKTLDTRATKLEAKKVEGPAARADRAVPVPRAAALRAHRARGRGPREVLRRPARVRGRLVQRRPRESGC